MAAHPDRWSRWLLEGRDANDEGQRRVVLEHLSRIRDRVLSNAEPLDGVTLLDVGAGDGLIALEALDRVGPQGTVIFSDISPALIAKARQAVQERGRVEQARFALARAEDLAAIQDDSVDVVTTRSVLLYVADKPRAFAAMRRVLRPGGRISLFEPINRLMFPEASDRFWGYDVTEVEGLANEVKAAFHRLEQPAADTMTDFDDRDLVRLAEGAGFERIHLECHIDIEPGSIMRATSLDALLGSAPNPLAPTVAEAVAEGLEAPDKRRRFVDHLARQVRAGTPVRRSAVAYLTAHEASEREASSQPRSADA
jgi:arsenite methyltransferase